MDDGMDGYIIAGNNDVANDDDEEDIQATMPLTGGSKQPK